jgi:hypothetical protein
MALEITRPIVGKVSFVNLRDLCGSSFSNQ